MAGRTRVARLMIDRMNSQEDDHMIQTFRIVMRGCFAAIKSPMRSAGGRQTVPCWWASVPGPRVDLIAECWLRNEGSPFIHRRQRPAPAALHSAR